MLHFVAPRGNKKQIAKCDSPKDLWTTLRSKSVQRELQWVFNYFLVYLDQPSGSETKKEQTEIQEILPEELSNDTIYKGENKTGLNN